MEVAGNFNDNRIIIFSAKDEGIYDAMNKGIKLAKGEWLYFLGSDDSLFDNHVLETVFQTIQNTNSKIIYGNVVVINDSGWAKDGAKYDGFFDLKKLLMKNICHQAVFYHQVIFKKTGNYNISYKVCADYDFHLKCYTKYHFLYVDLIVANFSGGSTSFLNPDVKFEKDKKKNILKYYLWQLHKKEFRPFLKSLVKNNVVLKIQLLIFRLQSMIHINKQNIVK